MFADQAAIAAVAERNRAFLSAERVKEQATRDANVEYSETVAKLRERFEFDLAQAAEHRRRRTLPAQRAYNAAVIAAERKAHAVTPTGH